MNVGVAFDVVPSKIHSPKMVCDLKWFLAFKYIFEYGMYISTRKPFKKIYEQHFKNS